MTRRWLDYVGNIFEASDAEPPTVYDRVSQFTHRISSDGYGPLQQALTSCGKRACRCRVRNVPAMGPVDCPECKKAEVGPRKVFYDTEFVERPGSLELISIGLVDLEGREYYAVNADMPRDWVSSHPWLRANVLPHLPRTTVARAGFCEDGNWLDLDHPDVKPKEEIAADVLTWLRLDQTDEPQWRDLHLWSYYAAFDHVMLSWLWGVMSQLPAGIPMFTRDLMQVAEQLWCDQRPPEREKVHHALEDAKWDRDLYNLLRTRGAGI